MVGEGRGGGGGAGVWSGVDSAGRLELRLPRLLFSLLPKLPVTVAGISVAPGVGRVLGVGVGLDTVTERISVSV
jgi:hypothetical protein